MISTILATIFFFAAFIIFSFKGCKYRNRWNQFVAINSFVVSSNSLKELLPSSYNSIINIARITICLLVICSFIYLDFKNKPTTNI